MLLRTGSWASTSKRFTSFRLHQSFFLSEGPLVNVTSTRCCGRVAECLFHNAMSGCRLASARGVSPATLFMPCRRFVTTSPPAQLSHFSSKTAQRPKLCLTPCMKACPTIAMVGQWLTLSGLFGVPKLGLLVMYPHVEVALCTIFVGANTSGTSSIIRLLSGGQSHRFVAQLSSAPTKCTTGCNMTGTVHCSWNCIGVSVSTRLSTQYHVSALTPGFFTRDRVMIIRTLSPPPLVHGSPVRCHKHRCRSGVIDTTLVTSPTSSAEIHLSPTRRVGEGVVKGGMMGKLNALSAKALSTPGRHGDGLYLNIAPSGAKPWVQRTPYSRGQLTHHTSG